MNPVLEPPSTQPAPGKGRPLPPEHQRATVLFALGIFCLMAWWLLYQSPDEQPRLSAAEWDYLRSGQPTAMAPAAKVSWLSLLGYRAVRAYIAMSILAGPGRQ